MDTFSVNIYIDQLTKSWLNLSYCKRDIVLISGVFQVGLDPLCRSSMVLALWSDESFGQDSGSRHMSRSVLLIVECFEQFIEVDLQPNVAQLVIPLAALDSNEIVVLKLLRALKKLRITHPWQRALATVFVYLFVDLRLCQKFFLSEILKDLCQRPQN